MTAEIAILNRSAVALAADSAVTLSVRGQEKIYNSVDKLFHLSMSDPIGVMIFGNAELMGIPIETIVKTFRKTEYCRTRGSLREYCNDFFCYIEKGISFSPQHVANHVTSIVADEIEKITNDKIQEILNSGSINKSKASSIQSALREKVICGIKARIDELRALKICDTFQNLNLDNIFGNHSNVVIEKIKDICLESNQEFEDLTIEMSKLLILKEEFSQFSTGMVFAGFGENEMFPKMIAFETEGIFGGRLKRVQRTSIDIDGIDVGAHIEPFAQREMVDRFLDGVDPSYNNYISNSMVQVLNEFSNEIISQFPKIRLKKKKEVREYASKLADEYLKNFCNSSEKRRKTNYRQKILDMVHYMPKSDLAAMAESLVNLTSTKRRVSAEKESVGGPVDVAVISRGEGFVWIKRKHYFERDLNPRYFVNQGEALTEWKMRNGKDI